MYKVCPRVNYPYLIIPNHAAYLSRSYLNVEVAPLVGDLEDLWPGKAVDPQPIAVNQQAVGTDTQHYVNPFRILQDSKEAGITEEQHCVHP